MATYDRYALRLLSPDGIRGGGGGKGSSRAVNRFWVDKVTIDVDQLNADLDTAIAAGDIITFGEVTRDLTLLQGAVYVHTASTAAATLDLGHSGSLDSILDGTSIAATGHTPMLDANSAAATVSKPSSGTRTITLEFKTGTAAGAVFTVWWGWVDSDLDEKLYGVG